MTTKPNKRKPKASEKENEVNDLLKNVKEVSMNKNGSVSDIEPIIEISLVKQDPNKYWIKQGMEVCHVDNKELKMYVDRIQKIVRKINIGNGEMRDKTFILGVDCHWLDAQKEYKKGLFNTKELEKYQPKTTK